MEFFVKLNTHFEQISENLLHKSDCDVFFMKKVIKIDNNSENLAKLKNIFLPSGKVRSLR